MRSRRARGRAVCVRALLRIYYYLRILLVWKVHIIIYLILYYTSHILDFRHPPICNNTILVKYIQYTWYTLYNAVVPVINACIIIYPCIQYYPIIYKCLCIVLIYIICTNIVVEYSILPFLLAASVITRTYIYILYKIRLNCMKKNLVRRFFFFKLLRYNFVNTTTN